MPHPAKTQEPVSRDNLHRSDKPGGNKAIPKKGTRRPQGPRSSGPRPTLSAQEAVTFPPPFCRRPQLVGQAGRPHGGSRGARQEGPELRQRRRGPRPRSLQLGAGGAGRGQLCGSRSSHQQQASSSSSSSSSGGGVGRMTGEGAWRTPDARERGGSRPDGRGAQGHGRLDEVRAAACAWRRWFAHAVKFCVAGDP